MIAREPWMNDCAQLCELYCAGTEGQGTWLRSRVDGKVGRVRAEGVAARFCDWGFERERCADRALAALPLCGDCRCGRSGAIREVAATSGAALGTRYPEVQSIGSMGTRQVETEDGVGFR